MKVRVQECLSVLVELLVLLDNWRVEEVEEGIVQNLLFHRSHYLMSVRHQKP